MIRIADVSVTAAEVQVRVIILVLEGCLAVVGLHVVGFVMYMAVVYLLMSADVVHLALW